MCKASGGGIRVFDQGIALNEKFKLRAQGDAETSRQLRLAVTQFDEGPLSVCLKRAVTILSKENQPRLMHKLLEVVVSYENSADEELAYLMGLIFGAKPNALEGSLQTFSRSKQRIIVDGLKFGWLNAKAEFTPAVVHDRARRLK